ncbi:uncharacterized protein LOC135843787 [Planococcus citri]|uniref:uncharacterized protein LOC135843787 n=1 Tax=Planococcus citri TaxID=170843 RepID=UPI0031FA3FF1
MATPTIPLTASPSTLQHSATLKTSMALWEHKIKHNKSTNLLHLSNPLPTDEVPLPNVLRKRLDAYTKSMKNQIWDWMTFHSKNVFPEKSMAYPLLYLKHLVWYDDGVIDYISTAKNLLRNPALSDSEKSNVAKVYFFLDFMSEMYPHLPKDELKTWFSPAEKFNAFKEISRQVSGYNLLRIHKRMAEFMTWYFSDNRSDIISFTFPRLREVQGSSDEILVRTLLLGLGYGVPLPV